MKKFNINKNKKLAMRKLLLSLALMSCFLFLQAQDGTISLQTKGLAKQVCTNDSFNSFEASFAFESIESNLVETEKGTFSAVTIANTFPSGADGTPELPVARKLIAVPHGAVPQVVVKSYDETEYKLSDFGIKSIYPHQPSVRKDMRPEDVKFVYSEKAYTAKSYEDRPVAQVEVLGTLRDLRIGTLTINPVIYNPANNSIIVRNNIDVEVVFEGADYEATKTAHEKSFNRHFAGIYNQMFNRDVYTEHPDLYNNPTYMMVVCPDEWIETLEPWVEWKTKVGIYVDVYPTSETGSTYNAIKSFVHNKFAEGQSVGETPTYLVLVGDVDKIPNENGSSSHAVTDLYYASVDGDYFPDMYYSRMSVANAQELGNIIEKSMHYEQVLTDDVSYLGEALLIAGVDGSWNPQVGQPAINYAHENHFTAENGYTEIHKYLNSYSGCYDKLDEGVAFANYTAHGAVTGWGNPAFYNNDVNNLTNEGMYFLAIGNCCVAADFGASVCFAEAMTRAPQKGAYAYIGSCPNTYWYEDYYWGVGATNVYGRTPQVSETTDGVYDALNWDSAFNVVSSFHFFGNIAICYAHDNNYGTHSSPTYYWQAYHTFGDPSIMPYCGVPVENEVVHLDIFPIGLDYFEVTAVPGSIVAITKDGFIHGTAVVDETGFVSVPITPVLSGGPVDITITCHNRLPYTTAIEAAALDGPFVVADDFQLDGDGILSYGETTGLSLTIKNVGNDPTVGATNVVLTTDDPLITINQAEGSCDVIEVGGNQTITGFEITASQEIEDEHLFIINVNASNSDTTWQSTIRVNAYKPVLEFGNFSWNGSFEPGDVLDIDVVVLNTGGFIVNDVMATLTTTSEYVTINTPEMTYGNIEAGAYQTATFNVTVSENCEITERLPFEISFSGDNGVIVADGEFELSNSCFLQFVLEDSYGDGWNNAVLNVSFSDGSPIQAYTIQSGSLQEYLLEVSTGTDVTLTWQSGSYDSECSFAVYYADNGIEIYSASHPDPGLLTTFTMDCSINCAGALNFVVTAAGGGVMNLSWEAPSVGDVDYYIIYRDGEVIAEITETQYEDSGLEDGTYLYCVETVHVDGCIGMPACAEALCCDFFDMPANGSVEIETCNAMLYDNGGANGNYSANSNGTAVIYPETEGANIRLQGNYDVENNYDKIYLYDGPNSQSDLIGTFTGSGSLDETSTNGPITVVFTSDGSVQKTGFAFAITCEGGDPVSDIPGDADGNFEVNVNDIIMIISNMFGSTPEGFIFANADVNIDGVINVLDVQIIVNIILGDKYEECTDPLQAEYFIQDGILYIETPVAISAFQFVFNLNENLNIKPMEKTEEFSLTSMMLGSSQYMAVGYSLDYASIPAGLTPLFRVGDATVEDIVLSDIAGCLIEAHDLLGIDDMSMTTKAYPNPFDKQVNVEFDAQDGDVVELTFTNINGQVVDYAKVTGTNNYIWTPNVENGIYFVVVTINGSKSTMQKLIKK